jgi:hypothetical protein
MATHFEQEILVMRRNAWMVIAIVLFYVPPIVAAGPAKDDAAAAASADKAEKAAKKAEAAANDADQSRKDAEAAARKIPNDATNYLGDRIVFKTIVNAEASVDGGKTWKDVCIPAGNYLQGINPDGSGSPEFTPDCNWCQFFEGFPHFCNDKRIEQCASTKTHTDKDCTLDDDQCIPEGAIVKISADKFTSTPPQRYGWTFGGLVVPFKLQLAGKHEFKGSASAAPYIGYRLGFGSGIEIAPVGFAGVGNVEGKKTTTTQTATGTVTSDDTSQLAALSYGVGVIGVLKNSFQFGFMLGFDHVGSGQGYKYNDKPWLALELGYAWQ